MREIYTSYYSALKGIDLGKYKPFSISTGDYKFLTLPKVEPLCPNRVMKCSKYEWRDLSPAEYTQNFLNGLKRMDSSGELDYILNQLKKLSGEAKPLLLCFEKFENGCFCHRHIIGEYLKQTKGFKAYEIIKGKKHSYDFSIDRNIAWNIAEAEKYAYTQATLF